MSSVYIDSTVGLRAKNKAVEIDVCEVQRRPESGDKGKLMLKHINKCMQ